MNLSSLVARVGSIVARSGAAHCTFLSGIATAKELGMRLRKACSLVLTLCLLGQPAGAQAHLTMVKEGYATTSAGIQIHYVESGANTSSPTLVLIPGWLLPASLWQDQLTR